MTNRTFLTSLSLAVVVVSTSALVRWGVPGEPTAAEKPAMPRPDRCAGRDGPVYPEIQGPASLRMDLLEGMAAGTPVAIRVSASSTIPISRGVLTLRVPEIAGEPNWTAVLWTGTPAASIAETATYSVGALPSGRYCYVAIFEFTPEEEGAETMAISQCLYLDVRPTTILSSNVSFDQIRRVELRQELERRILAGLKPKLAAASEDVIARERTRLEIVDPGFMDRAMEHLIATDPDAGRRVMELNER